MTTNVPEYLETKTKEQRTVGWKDAVPTYAALVFKYGFLFGFGLWALAWLMPRNGYPNMPQSLGVLLWLVVSSIMAGLAGAGFGGLISVIIKDILYPYARPLETVKALPRMAAPFDAKPRPFMRTMSDNTIYFGKEKLDPGQWLALAKAVVANGERMISRRRLADWGVVADRHGPAAAQIINDLVTLQYVEGRGNDLYEASDQLVEFLAGMFPALPVTPLP